MTHDLMMPESRCPYCDYHLGQATTIDPDDPSKPNPGDLAVCISCAQALVFDDDLRVRAPRPGEIKLSSKLRRVQRAVRATDRRRLPEPP